MIIEGILAVLIQEIASHAVEELMLAVADDGKDALDCFQQIAKEIRLVKAFLEGAEAMRSRTKINDEWVAQLTREAYEAEDLFDMFLALIQSSNMRSGGLIGSVHKFIHFPKESMKVRNIAAKARKVCERIQDTMQKRETFGIPKLDDVDRHLAEGSHKSEQLPLDQLHGSDEGENLVGVEESKEQVIAWLSNEEKKQTRVVSVWGMGGLGKTSLARAVYDDPKVMHLFAVRAWVCVTQTYHIDDLLRSMVRGIKQELAGRLHDQLKQDQSCSDTNSNTSAELSDELRELLAERRYLIILDDVWDVPAFVKLSHFLPNKNNGSRILVTTRHENVASFASSANIENVLNISPLTDEHAATLFHQHAFGGATCPADPELDEGAQRIIGKCKGWPLALVIIGRVMAGKLKRGSNSIAWKDTFQHLDWELSHNEIFEGLMARVVMLSYKSLPHHLQRCFLYCTLFKEDHPIKTKWLIRMWIAEGFIVVEHANNNNKTLEEIGSWYVEQLAAKSMLHVTVKYATGRPKICQVHGIVRDLVLTASRGENVCATSPDHIARLNETCRRLSIMKTLGDKVKPNNHLSRIRTLLVASTSDPSFTSSLHRICRSLKFLRVLELRGAPIHSLPSNVFDLFNLRYLGLRETNVSEIPSDLEKLVNLQTLDLWQTKVRKLPRAIVKLRQLRHLYQYDIRLDKLRYLNLGPGLLRGREAPSGISDLTNLQTLQTITASPQTLNEIASLTQLRSLAVTDLDTDLGSTLCSSISRMERLSCLYIESSPEHTLILELDGLSAPPAGLHKLTLFGHLHSIPTWFSSLNNLTILYLVWSHFRQGQNPLPSLGTLPNLVKLILIESYEGESMDFEAGCFKRLEFLFIGLAASLTRLSVQKGGLPSLKLMRLRGLTNLKLVEGLQYITGIQTLDLYYMPTTLMLNPSHVQHIPNIIRN